MKKIVLALATGFIVAAVAGCLENVTEVPLTIPGEAIGAPEGLTAAVGDAMVTLAWGPVDGAVSYRVYRAIDTADRFERLAETADTSFVDSDVQDGRLYYYAVSAVSSGKLEGRRSTQIYASPAAYAVLIDGGASSTRSTSVVLSLTAPATTVNMLISDDSTFAGEVWGNYAATQPWTIRGVDGLKRIYVKFRDASGAVSSVVSGSIILDRYAMIQGLAIGPVPRRYSPGTTVHFTLRVEGNETDGAASVTFEGFAAVVALYDDGRGGDAYAGDGVYEADFRLPSSIRGIDVTVAADFTDETGNVAPQFECPDRVSITDPPAAVQLIGAVDSTTTGITIKWTSSQDSHFRSYRVYRNTSSTVSETPSQLVDELSGSSQTTYTDTGLKEGALYYYRVFVANDLGETAGSNTLAARTFDAVPDPVVLDDPSSLGQTRLTLTWRASAATDFREYRIYRATQPGVTSSSMLVTTITNREQTYFDDSGLDLAGNTYYYRVFVYDLAGKSSRSNEVDTAP
jgi:fibronectin type 3 domain-containing protein